MIEINSFANQTNQQANQGFAEQSQFQSNQAFNQSQNQNFNQQTNSAKGLFQIPEKFLQLIPWIPVGLEMLTGQKIPATGVLADILNGIQQVQFQVSQVLTQQQRLWNKLESLESNASSQLNNLSQQVTNANKDFRLLATETKRSLELNSRPRINEPESYE